MNIIDKLIDSRVQSSIPLFNLPDLKNWTESSNIFQGNMFPITPNQLSRLLKVSSPNSNAFMSVCESKDKETDKYTDEEDFCAKCQKRFCNKYYLKKHKIEVHKLELDIEHSFDNFQQKTPFFRPSPFNSLFNSSFSNFLLQKSMSPMFSNMMLPQVPLPQSFNSPPSALLSQAMSQSSQTVPMFNPIDFLTSSSETDVKIPNLSSSMFNEFRNAMVKVPTEPKLFSNINITNNGLQDSIQCKPKPNTCSICGFQLAGSESAFLDHLYHCHGNDKSSNQSPNTKNLLKRESPDSSVANGESYISPFDAFKSSMAAAKLADRVTCDICHKDLCNKYFLRTHKLKLHGIQAVDSTCRAGKGKEKQTVYERVPSQFEQLNSPSTFLASPFSGSSFCDPILGASIFSNITRPMPVAPEQGCYCPICKRLISLPYFLPLHMWNVHGIGMGNSNVIIPNLSATKPAVDAASVEHSFLPVGVPSKNNQAVFPLSFAVNGMDQNMGSKWYRKSPNQMRVRCDICDKWICNKYFLRTHKLNKHGVTDSGSNTDVNSDSVSHSFYVDSTIANLDSLVPNPNLTTSSDSAPLDLSTSPSRDTLLGIESKRNILSKFPCDAIMSHVNHRSVWNTGLVLNLPIQHPSHIVNQANTVTPLDLSTKLPKDTKSPIDNNSSLHPSLVILTAKRLKSKYQKIFKSRIFRRLSVVKQRQSSFLAQSQCFSCPLCGKELQDAPRFLHHLTQFHDMVLPGKHTARGTSHDLS